MSTWYDTDQDHGPGHISARGQGHGNTKGHSQGSVRGHSQGRVSTRGHSQGHAIARGHGHIQDIQDHDNRGHSPRQGNKQIGAQQNHVADPQQDGLTTNAGQDQGQYKAGETRDNHHQCQNPPGSARAKQKKMTQMACGLNAQNVSSGTFAMDCMEV